MSALPCPRGGWNNRNIMRPLVPTEKDLAMKRRQLAKAVRLERYEEAAALRDQLAEWEERVQFRQIEQLLDYVGIRLPKVTSD